MNLSVSLILFSNFGIPLEIVLFRSRTMLSLEKYRACYAAKGGQFTIWQRVPFCVYELSREFNSFPESYTMWQRVYLNSPESSYTAN